MIHLVNSFVVCEIVFFNSSPVELKAWSKTIWWEIWIFALKPIQFLAHSCVALRKLWKISRLIITDFRTFCWKRFPIALKNVFRCHYKSVLHLIMMNSCELGTSVFPALSNFTLLPVMFRKESFSLWNVSKKIRKPWITLQRMVLRSMFGK